MIYIVSDSIPERLYYTCEVLFKHILQVKFELITSDKFPLNTSHPVINYTAEPRETGIHIHPHPLLFEESIQPQHIVIQHKNEVPYFFKTSKETEWEFDIFATTFYMVSRYEEYLPFEPDRHGRFTAQHSLAFKAGFLEVPVVHLWTEALKKSVLKHYPHTDFPQSKFSQFNTIDIDMGYAYRGKPFLRQLGGIFNTVWQFDFAELKQRFRYYFTGKDPFDSYFYIEKTIQKSNIPAIFFINLGKHGKFDKNLPLTKTMRSLIKRLSRIGSVGIHPSYGSNENSKELTKEVDSLQNTINQPIINSRQHYLKLRFPETYENLIRNGIQTDYTMGFAEQIGFRAGISVPYPFFNIEKNEIRPLTLVPFQIMDGTLKDYQNLTVKQALQKVITLKQSVQNVNGTLVSIFHNSSLTDSGEWKNWQHVYEAIILKN